MPGANSSRRWVPKELRFNFAGIKGVEDDDFFNGKKIKNFKPVPIRKPMREYKSGEEVLYEIGDIAAIQINEKVTISCKIISHGIGRTKKSDMIFYKDIQIKWIKGYNGRWPGWVHQMFRGEEPTDADAETGQAIGVCEEPIIAEGGGESPGEGT